MRRVVQAGLLTVMVVGCAAAPAYAATFPYVAPTVENPAPFHTTTVPAGMRLASVEMFGASSGGKGARVTALLEVTPGQVLRVYVGGEPDPLSPTASGAGYNGGGRGFLTSPGGGGASDVRTGEAESTRLVVAGGGGGNGLGGAGGDSGKDGQDGSGSVAGKGGKSGNAGGGGGAAGSGGFFVNGTAGGSASGGTGGAATSSLGGYPYSGAGGGGLVGGGAGGSGAVPMTYVDLNTINGGGGGGSSLAPRGTIDDGVRSGNGEVTINYSAGDPTPASSSPGSTGGQLTPSTITVKDSVKPSLGALGLSRSAFAAAPSGASLSAKRRKQPIGTKVSYSLTEAATVRFTVQQKASGRKSGKKCVKPTKRNAKKGKCTRWVNLRGSFTHAGKAGRNSFTFRGRVGGRKLKPGSYRLTATATDPAKNASVPRNKTFKIVP